MEPTTDLIGLIELPRLAPCLADAGVSVVTGEALRDAARDIRAAIVAGRGPVILARQTSTPGLQPFLTRAGQAVTVVLLVPPQAEPMPIAGAVVVRLPASLSAVLDAAGVAADLSADVVIDADGVPGPPLPQAVAGPARPDPDDDWLGEAVVTTGAQVAAAPPPWDRDDPHPDPIGAGPDADPGEEVIGGWVPQIPPWDVPPAPAAAPHSAGGEPAPRRPPALTRTLRKDDPPTAAAAPAPGMPPTGPDRVADRRPWAAATASVRSVADPDTETEPGDRAPVIDLFGSPSAHEHRRPGNPGRRRGTDLAPTLIVFSGKGGPGKTAMSINIAQRAAELCPDLRVSLIDGNIGQGDIRSYLRFDPAAQVPSVLDAAISGDPADAVLSPEQANAARHPRLPPVRFALVLAPTGTQADPRLVTAAVLAGVLEAARRNSDLVVMDTQIVEATDRTGIIDDLVAPALIGHAWGLAICDTSSAGAQNLHTVLAGFHDRGMRPDRVTVLVNRAQTAVPTGSVRLAYGEYAAAFHHIDHDPVVVPDMNVGRFVHTRPGFADAIDDILLRILRRPEFDRSERAAPASVPRPGWWRWWRS